MIWAECRNNCQKIPLLGKNTEGVEECLELIKKALPNENHRAVPFWEGNTEGLKFFKNIINRNHKMRYYGFCGTEHIAFTDIHCQPFINMNFFE